VHYIIRAVVASTRLKGDADADANGDGGEALPGGQHTGMWPIPAT